MERLSVAEVYVKAFAKDSLDAWIETFGPGATYSDPGTSGPLAAGEALRDHFAGLFAGFPDASFETVGLHAVSEQLAVWRWIMRGTNTGSYRGLPPTGRSVILPGCEFIEVRDGRVRRVEGYFDRLSLLSQLGLAPDPSRPSSV